MEELIVDAAIYYNGKIYKGKRHADIMKIIWDSVGCPVVITQEQQGFMTSSGGFVSRRVAARIAYDAGQIKHLKRMLLSEDLW